MSHRNEITDDKTGAKVTVIVISDQPDGECQFCHKKAEVRPYGPGGKQICHDCGFNHYKETVEHNMGIQLFGLKGELK